jgi:hypothetical protein
MRRIAVLAGIVALLPTGCGSGGEAPVADAPEPGTTVTTIEPTLTAETHAVGDSQPTRPLTKAERRRVEGIAARLDRAIDRFDRTVSSCTGADRGACVDRAWAVIVTDAEWPLYYLVRMRPRARGCDALAAAMAELDGFNLAGRQIDYGPPGEADTSRSGARIALVDTLRPLPDELRTAAAAACS